MGFRNAHQLISLGYPPPPLHPQERVVVARLPMAQLPPHTGGGYSDLCTHDCQPTLTDTQVLEFCKSGFLKLEAVVPDWVNEKAFTRCGMGRCQGRFCGPALGEIVASANGEPPGRLRTQAPVRPIPLVFDAGPIAPEGEDT